MSNSNKQKEDSHRRIRKKGKIKKNHKEEEKKNMKGLDKGIIAFQMKKQYGLLLFDEILPIFFLYS
jgi:hypothetical protein